jgi:hypothetical protein
VPWVATSVIDPPGCVARRKVQPNAPPLVVVIVDPLKDPAVQLIGVRVTEPMVSVREVAPWNPEPLTSNVLPIVPCPGVTVIEGTVTANWVVATSPPASVATTDDPEVPEGTAIVHANAPVAPVRSDPDAQVETVTPSKTKLAIPVETENPIPEIVTLVPTGPWLGDAESDTAVTVNVTELLAVDVARSVATTG